MSLQNCGTGITGFPLRLNRNIFDPNWLGADESSRKKMVSPIDFDIQWGKANPGMQIETVADTNVFQIKFPDDYANTTSITYGRGKDLLTYKPLPYLSLTKIQHGTLVNQNGNPTQEAILAFTIDRNAKQNNPSSPDIILLCRPLVLSADASSATGASSNLWRAINESVKTTPPTRKTTTVDLSSIYTYGGGDQLPLPMMTYETCIPTRFISSTANSEGSVLIRVHVATNPLTIYSENTGTGKCTTINNYIFPESIKRLISPTLNKTDLQFSTGSGGANYQYPSSRVAGYYTPIVNSAIISSWPEVKNKIEYLIPESLLGKSLADIANQIAPPIKKSSARKQFKCYPIDPRKDIVGDQITIDPTSGERLDDFLKEQAAASSGGDPELAAALAGKANEQTGIMPADVEYGIFITLSLVGSIFFIAYFFHIVNLYSNEHEDFYKHLVIFIVIFVVLVIALIFLDKSIKNK